ncbi:MAG: ATP-dependent DNA helicase [Myxococcales bacterium]|nr:ATP-dependent DNA helicase [Myxococcales bacterium]MCB9629457.1 ATP-dependent DNA helicase [Sandaracinaceae bacterium]
MRAADLLGPTGPLARVIPGYEHREGQMRMAEAVQRALEDRRMLLVEAGTGTGKTLAYLLPAILSGQKVVISTGTRTLQDQILDHDLPLLRQHLGTPVSASAMKGLANYVCRRRFAEFVAGPRAVEARYRTALPLLQEFHEASETGDRAALPALAEDHPVWPHIVSGSDTRVGKGCRYYDSCFVTRMRERAREAQIVVVNHHLFFSDLAVRGPHGGGLLPDYDAVIFDEAHQIEDVATLFFGHEVGTGSVERLAEDVARALSDEGPAARAMSDALVVAAGRFFGALPDPGAGRAHLGPQVFQGRVEDALFGLDDALGRVEEHLAQRAHEGERLAQLARRAADQRRQLIQIAETPEAGARVAYSEARGRGRVIGSRPVDVSELLRNEVWQRIGAVVLTSATLSTGGDFKFIKQRLGVDFQIAEERVSSPFDYAQQAALYLPEAMPDPRAPGYLERAVREITELVALTGGGAFVLCTSVRAMRTLAQRCAGSITQPIFVQGEAPKGTLLDRFREAGNAVLFATLSFWEGVDVPGDALRLVVLDKLPFSVPTDPLIAARCRMLEEQGESPFMRYLVPAAALTLQQGFGRLIRTQRDRGVVAVLDGRVVQKAYGRVFLASLPPASRHASLAELRTWWGPPGPDETNHATRS